MEQPNLPHNHEQPWKQSNGPPPQYRNGFLYKSDGRASCGGYATVNFGRNLHSTLNNDHDHDHNHDHFSTTRSIRDSPPASEPDDVAETASSSNQGSPLPTTSSQPQQLQCARRFSKGVNAYPPSMDGGLFDCVPSSSAPDDYSNSAARRPATTKGRLSFTGENQSDLSRTEKPGDRQRISSSSERTYLEKCSPDAGNYRPGAKAIGAVSPRMMLTARVTPCSGDFERSNDDQVAMEAHPTSKKKPEKRMDVLVSYVDSPSEFYLQVSLL